MDKLLKFAWLAILAIVVACIVLGTVGSGAKKLLSPDHQAAPAPAEAKPQAAQVPAFSTQKAVDAQALGAAMAGNAEAKPGGLPFDDKTLDALAGALEQRMHDDKWIARQFNEQPELVAQALVLWGRRQQQGPVPDVKPGDVDPALLVRSMDKSKGVLVGAENPAFTIVEFIDPNCVHCRGDIQDILDWADKTPNVAILFRDMPVVTKESPDASKVALALGSQGLYRPWLEAIARHDEKPIGAAEARVIAKGLGADMQRLEAAVGSTEEASIIADNLDLGSRLAIDGTPAFIVGSKLLVGTMTSAWLSDFAGQQGAPVQPGFQISPKPEAAPASTAK